VGWKCRELTCRCYHCQFVPRVGELVGRFHALSPKLLPLCANAGTGSVLEERLNLWTAVAQKTAFPHDELRTRKLHALAVDHFASDTKWLVHKLLPSVASPVVFVHGDVQEGNILLGVDGLHLIDFEYSDRMERGFDLGNAFCEMSMTYHVTHPPGFCINPDHYPSRDVQLAFCAAYARGAGLDPGHAGTLDKLLKEAEAFAMVSHFMWSIWAVCMAQTSEHNFGYLEYAEQRLYQFREAKKRWAD
jgi:thiamine kinase-like enzyme